jgi:hypothetical protein
LGDLKNIRVIQLTKRTEHMKLAYDFVIFADDQI